MLRNLSASTLIIFFSDAAQGRVRSGIHFEFSVFSFFFAEGEVRDIRGARRGRKSCYATDARMMGMGKNEEEEGQSVAILT